MDFLTSSQTSLAPSSLASSTRNPGGWVGVNTLKSAPLLLPRPASAQPRVDSWRLQLEAWAPMEPRLGPGAAALRLGWPAQLLWVSALSSAVSSPAPPSPRTSYNLGRSVLGLDKCNACIGTSICKKFFKEEIRSESQSDHSEGQNAVPVIKDVQEFVENEPGCNLWVGAEAKPFNQSSDGLRLGWRGG